MHTIEDLTESYGEQPYSVFESTGVYSMQLERFMNDNGSTYCPLNPLEAKLQCDSLRIHKTDKSDAHRIPLLIFPLTGYTVRAQKNSFYN